jgi:glycine/D-amino acid oxidase-like deaminating enzyme
MQNYLIIGAGLQGCCIALELAKRGQKVTLIERDHQLFNRASLRNEGKVHLGLVYMNDPSFETPLFMLQGALLFRKSLERWIGEKSNQLGLSKPFYYLVAKDSFLQADQLQQGYARLQEAFELWKKKNHDWDYLGQHPEVLYERSIEQEITDLFGEEIVCSGFRTAELAIDTEVLREHMVEAVYAQENIRVLTNTRVESIVPDQDLFELTITDSYGKSVLLGDAVINCAWDGKYVFDQQIGLSLPSNLLHRLKYRIIVKLPDALRNRPSATMVIGKYGDVVNQNNGYAYLSWYPSACLGWSHDVSPPANWEQAARGVVDPELANQLSNEFLHAIEKWYPGIQESIVKLVDAGPIVAYGKTDVDDADSTLHNRSGIGFKSVGNYHSIETGKLTTAPMIAVNFVNTILGL